MTRRTTIVLGVTAFAVLHACTDSSSTLGVKIPNTAGPPELVFVQSLTISPTLNTEIRVVDSQGLNGKRILGQNGIERDVRVAPDGARLAFIRQIDANFENERELYVGSLDGSVGEQRLTRDDFIDNSPTWRPDGSQILFTSNRLGDQQMFTINPDGTNLQAFLPNGFVQFEPDWSPSADLVVFAGIDPGVTPARTQLYVIDPLAGPAVPLMPGGSILGVNDRYPAWSPDGNQVLFTRMVSADVGVLAIWDIPNQRLSIPPVTPELSIRARWSPHADRVFYIGRRAAAGVATDRLWTADVVGDGTGLFQLSAASMVLPDERFDLPGLDVLPAMAVAPSGPEETVGAALVNRATTAQFGRSLTQPDFMLDLDNRTFDIQSTPNTEGDREVAAYEFSLPLPVTSPTDVRRTIIRVVAGVENADPTALLRITLYNTCLSRSDTIAEITPAADGSLHTLEVPVHSLAHVDAGKSVIIAIVGSRAAGAIAELKIDFVDVRAVRPIAAAPAGRER